MALPAPSELLMEPTDFDAGPKTVQHLSTAQLALAALRPDLDCLTRQRAYVLVSSIPLEYALEAHALTRSPFACSTSCASSPTTSKRKISVDENPGSCCSLLLLVTPSWFDGLYCVPVFEQDHTVSLNMDDLPRLSPAQLLIAQFTPGATQDLCAAAGRQFLTQAASYQKGQLAQLECKVFKLERSEGDDYMETEAMVLVVREGGLTLEQRSEELFFLRRRPNGKLEV